VWVATVKTLHLKGLGDRVLTLHSEQKQKYEKGNWKLQKIGKKILNKLQVVVA
jgi:hypothetical protein